MPGGLDDIRVVALPAELSWRNAAEVLLVAGMAATYCALEGLAALLPPGPARPLRGRSCGWPR